MAPHVQAAINASVQLKTAPAGGPVRPMAPHVQAAVNAAQPKAAPAGGAARPVAPHVHAVVNAAAQPKIAPPRGPVRPTAPHVQAAINGAAQPKILLAGGAARPALPPVPPRPFEGVQLRTSPPLQPRLQVAGRGAYSVVQAALNVAFKTTGNIITTLAISGRPKWAARVTKNLTPGPGQVRGHIIEWNTRARAFVNQYKGKNKKALTDLLGIRSSSDDSAIQHSLFEHLKAVYNDLENLTLNDEEADTAAGGLANTIAQVIDRGGLDEEARMEKLMELYPLGLNAGGAYDQWIDKYNETFAMAWGIDPEVVAAWAGGQSAPEPEEPREVKIESRLKKSSSKKPTPKEKVRGTKREREKEPASASPDTPVASASAPPASSSSPELPAKKKKRLSAEKNKEKKKRYKLNQKRRKAQAQNQQQAQARAELLQ
jgi:hypothetical protein